MKNLSLKSLAVAALVFASVLSFAQDNGGQGGRQGRRGGGQFAQRGGLQAGPMLLFRADVQSDLALTDDQKSKLNELRQTLRGGRRRGQGGNGGNGGNGGERPNREQMQAQRAEQQKKINEILNPDQQKRLKEISIQLAGAQAIVSPEIQKELGLSTAQVSKIESLQKTYRDAMTSVRERARNNEIDRQAAQSAQQKNNEVLKEELQKVLTPEQSEKLKAMGGKPFKAEAGRNR